MISLLISLDLHGDNKPFPRKHGVKTAPVMYQYISSLNINSMNLDCVYFKLVGIQLNKFLESLTYNVQHTLKVEHLLVKICLCFGIITFDNK